MFLVGILIIAISWGIGVYTDTNSIIESHAYFWCLGAIPSMIGGFLMGFRK